MSTAPRSPSRQLQEITEFLSSAAAELASVRDLPALAEVLHGIIVRLINVEYSGIYFIEPHSGVLRLYAAPGFSPEERLEAERTAMDRHPGRVMRSGQMLHIPDVQQDSAQQSRDSLRSFVVRSRLFLPVVSEGRGVGTIGLGSSIVDCYTAYHIATLQFACQLAGVIYKNVNDSAELRSQLELVRRQEQELRRLSSPVIEVWDGVLVLPLIGTLNSQRFGLVTEKLLAETVAKRATAVILDLTGIDATDESGTLQLVRLCRAIELIGSRCLLSGISPATARWLTKVDGDLSRLRTFGSLRQALGFALRAT